MSRTKPKGLTEILEENPDLKEKRTFKEHKEQKPEGKEIPIEKAYDAYAAVKKG